jgi:histidyl-tRNA synthetase
MSVKAIKGMNDLLPDELVLWQKAEKCIEQLFALYHYSEIRTPLVEPLELFSRTLGSTSQVVEKEMYSFEDRHGKKIALRPEGTASVVRSYIEKSYHQKESISRFYYRGPMYRYERPQRGRYRQFHQVGAEVIGTSNPLIDAELIHLVDEFFQLLNLSDVELQINSLGCPVCRPDYLRALNTFLEDKIGNFCNDCQRRAQVNPLRILDCKEESCKALIGEVPSIHEHLCEGCEGHFDQVLEGVGRFGSSYVINPHIVRGLDYYQKTAFEFIATNLGAQNAVAGGGRYDGLVRLLGGPHVPGVGFAIGLERLIDLMAQAGVDDQDGQSVLVYFATMGSQAIAKGIALADTLRKSAIPVEVNYEDKGLKALMKRADRVAAQFTVILGSEELSKKKLILRNMNTKEQTEIPLNEPERLIELICSQQS